MLQYDLTYSVFLAGCLIIIPNYTGDCLNFGLAIEKAKQIGLKVSFKLYWFKCINSKKNRMLL